MKAILCGLCFDIRGIEIDTPWTTCKCGNVSARWTDPYAGKVVVKARDRNKTRIIGMNNAMLKAAFAPTHELMVAFGDGTSFTWDQVHKQLCKDAKGYVFHESMRNCWACIVQVGETNDIRWEESENEAEKETKIITSDGNNNVPRPGRDPASKPDTEIHENDNQGAGQGSKEVPPGGI